MNKRITTITISYILVTAGFFSFLASESNSVRAAKTWYVGTGLGNDTAFIQDAIDFFATDGDTVYVHSGVYIESIIQVTKTINLIGENRDSTIITHFENGDIVQIRKDWVNVSGFTFLNGANGISLNTVHNCRVFNNHAFGNKKGISLGYSKYNIVSDNTVVNSSQIGIFLRDFGDNSIIDNNISDCETGIQIQSDSTNNLIRENKISNAKWGINVQGSNYNRLINNNISYSEEIGIRIAGSFKINLEGNTMLNNGIWFEGGVTIWNTHNIDTSNTVNSKPVEYWKNQTGGEVPQGAGQVILANCTNMSIEGQELTNATCGIILGLSSNNTIAYNNASSNSHYGIYLHASNGNNITENNASLNNSGIFISNSNENNIIGNMVLSSVIGIHIQFSSANKIIDNTIYKNEWGMSLQNSSYNTLIDNSILNNNYNVWLGIQSQNNNFVNCTLSNPVIYDFYLYGESHAFLLNTTFDTTRVFYEDTSSSLTVAWFMNINVIYPNRSPASNAQIWVNDTYGINIHNGPTDSEGWIKWIIAFEYGEIDMDGDNVGDKDYFTPHNVTATDGNLWGYAFPEPVMDKSKTIIIILGGRPFINLEPGWNLISVPFIQSNTSLGAVLNPIAGSYDAVQWYNVSDTMDHWKHNHILKPSQLNDLSEINHLMGFWIHITEPGGMLFEYNGIKPSQNQSIPLRVGWNLVGYPSLTSHNRTYGLNNIMYGPDVDCIQWYDASSQTWHFMGPDDLFLPGRGYWVHSKVDTVWDVPL